MSLSTRASPDKCTVYWAYENMPIPKTHNLTDILSTIKDKLWNLIGIKLPIEFKVYIRTSKVTKEILRDFDINGIVQIQIPSTKPESVDKRLMIDMAFSLFELERDNKSRAVALISSGNDFGHLLSRIHHTPPISHSFLILLRHTHIDKNLPNVVDHVIQLNYDSNYDETKTNCNVKNNKHIIIMLTNFMSLSETFQLKITFKNLRQRYIKKTILNYHQKNGKNANGKLTLLFKGKELEKGKSLKKVGICNGDTLMWCFDKSKNIKMENKKASEKIRIKFQNLYSKQTFEINRKGTNKIGNLRSEVYHRNKGLNMQECQFVLQYEGIELKNKKTIDYYKITDGDTLIWFTKSIPKIKITLYHRDNIYNKMEIESFSDDYICIIKECVIRKYQIDGKIISLIYEGKVLDGRKTLKKYGIKQNVVFIWKEYDYGYRKEDVEKELEVPLLIDENDTIS
eukprot:534865_1